MNELVPPGFLQDHGARFVFFGGKGGVGKTTLAAATALQQARYRPGEKVLITSTDPAHSLSDSFGQAIGSQVVPIVGVDNLFAIELDSEKLLAEWKEESDPMIAEVANRGTHFSQEDIDDFLNLTLPGMEDAMAVMRIVALAEAHGYTRVVVDTAPTGHTLRLLALPAQMRLWIKVMDRLMEKHRFIVRSLVGSYQPDNVDDWLVEMAGEVKHVASLLRDGRVTEFVPVTIPEEMAVCETERLVSTLEALPMSVKALVVNQMVPYDGRCAICRERREDQARTLAQIRERFAGLHLLGVPQLSHEVRGTENLTEIGRFLMNGSGPQEPEQDGSWRLGFGHYRDWIRAWWVSWGTRLSDVFRPGDSLRAGLLLPSARFIMVGGKGGVGKTTTSAATALYLARQHPDRKVLLFSTDPAHSIADSFAQAVGAHVTAIEPCSNLYAYEVDAARLLDDFKQEYRMNGEQPGGTFGEGVAGQMLDLIPPGLDEVMALLEVMKLAETDEFDVFILDTAPTGHLTRFLGLPELTQEWLRSAGRMLLRYKDVIRLGRLAELVIGYSRQVRQLRELLVDDEQTEFIAVTTPEASAVAEGEWLLQCLGTLDIACRQVLVNKVTQNNICPFCADRRRQERRCIGQLVERRPGLHLAQTPQIPHPVRGIEELTKFGNMLYRRR